MKFSSLIKLFVLLVLLTVISGCNKEETNIEELGIQSIATYKDEETETSYFVVTIQPNKKITLQGADLDGHYNDIEGQAIEYKKDSTVESWESSKQLKLPREVNKDERVRILFISEDPNVDVSVAEGVYIEVNGERLKREASHRDN